MSSAIRSHAPRRSLVGLILLVASLVSLPEGGDAAAAPRSSFNPGDFAALAVEPHPGALLPLNAELRDESGARVRLGDYFGRRPVLLVLEYLHCPNLCGLVLDGLAQTLDRVPLRAGQDYEVVAVSIDPSDTPADAARAKARYRESSAGAGQETGAASWHFLVADPATVAALAKLVGFPFRYDPATRQFAHPAGLTVATADGKISRYILGLGYSPMDLRLALLDTAPAPSPVSARRFLLLCYCYDPQTGRYSLAITRLIQVAGILTVLGIGVPLAVSFLRERRG